MKIKHAANTHIGARQSNQDYYAQHIAEDWAIFVLADGLGGHEAGDLAAKYFCDALIQHAKTQVSAIKETPEQGMQTLIQDAANTMSDKLMNDNHEGARTTCVIAWLSDEKLITAHIGDSRIYLLDKDKIHWRTKDHSMTQMLLEAGEITEPEMGTHPTQTRLLRSVGTNEIPNPDIEVSVPLKQNELLLLCSDGFWEMIHPEEMISLMQAEDLEAGIADLILKATERAGATSDNVTVEVVKLL